MFILVGSLGGGFDLVAKVIDVDLFLVDVRNKLARAIISFNLKLGPKLAVSHTPNECLMVSQCALFRIESLDCGLLLQIWTENLLWRKVLKNLVVDFEYVHSQLFVKGLFEFLC